MFDKIYRLMHDIQAAPKDQRGSIIAGSIFWALAYTSYYITLGIVVLVLGRRLIYAVLSAWKETRREPS